MYALHYSINQKTVQNCYSGAIVYQHASSREKLCTFVYFSLPLISKQKKCGFTPSLLSSRKHKDVAISSENCIPLSYTLLWKATEKEMTPILSVPLERTGQTWFKKLNKNASTRLVSPSSSAGGQEINLFFVLLHIFTTTELTKSCFGFLYVYIF